MTDDNGKGLRALFYGLCCLRDVTAWDEERMGAMPVDFYLPDFRAWVIIVPEPAARQVEIDAIRDYPGWSKHPGLLLDRWDLEEFRTCQDKVRVVNWLKSQVRTGDTHAARERQRLGLSS